MPSLTTTTLGRFCREIAGGLSPMDELAREWGLTPQTFHAVQASKAYRDEMLVVVKEMQDLGPDAGYVYRMKSLSEEFLAEVIGIAKAPETSPSLKFEIIRWCAEMARLKEKPPAKGDLQPGAQGPTVVFQFGEGLPIASMMRVVGEQAATAEAAPTLSLTPMPHTYDAPRAPDATAGFGF